MISSGEALSKAEAISSFLRTHHLRRTMRTRDDVELWQERRIATWLKRDVPAVPFYQEIRATHLGDLPVIDKATVMNNFVQFNLPGIGVEAAQKGLRLLALWKVFLLAEAPGRPEIVAITSSRTVRGTDGSGPSSQNSCHVTHSRRQR